MTLETLNGTYVFFSYAQRDKALRDQLENHLSNLKYRGLITTWHDREIGAGEERARQIEIYLNNARIILLLISANFMASEYCYGQEMRQALERHERGEAHVIPILLRPVLFTNEPFARLQMLPKNGRPVVKWSDRDSAFVDIACEIERIALIYKAKVSAENATSKAVEGTSNLSHPLALGSRLQGGRYSIKKVLGQEEMGANLLAIDNRLDGKSVVIKELLSESADQTTLQEDVRNFKREVAILAHIDHPLIPNVTDHFQEGTRYFMVQEYVEGENLENWLDRTKQPIQEREALICAVEVLDVLDYLSVQTPPVVHRDIKPANIIIGAKDKRAHLVDFSIAQVEIVRNAQRKQTAALGTPGYAPPEQYQGIADPRSDLYALGATLHHVLTTRDPRDYPPFFYPPVRTLNTQLSPEIERVVTQALSNDINQRYQHTDEMKQDIEKILRQRFGIVGSTNSYTLGASRNEPLQQLSLFPGLNYSDKLHVSPLPQQQLPNQPQKAKRISLLPAVLVVLMLSLLSIGIVVLLQHPALRPLAVTIFLYIGAILFCLALIVGTVVAVLRIIRARQEHIRQVKTAQPAKKCPYCGAETRPDDNYCLNCGNPLLPTSPFSAPQPPSSGSAPILKETPQTSVRSDIEETTVTAGNATELATQQADYPAPVAQVSIDRIEPGARFILRSDDGEVVQEYPLDRAEIRIGQAPDSDILLTKDKLTSRRHATIRYEGNQYVLQDERSANGTFINGQQIEEMVPQVLYDGDYIGIGEHELIFRTYDSLAENLESLNTVAVPFRGVPAQQPAVVDPVLGEQDPEAIQKLQYYVDTLKAYEDAIMQDPFDSAAYLGKGNVCYALQRYVAALDAFQQAIRLHPTAAAWAGIGNVLAKLQQYQQAVEAYEEALRLDDAVTLDYDALEQSLMVIGRVEEAERYRERARELGYYDEG